jgi:ComF family protein
VLADGLIAVLVSPSCAACDEPLTSPTLGPICARCWSSIAPFTPPVCRRCGDPLPTWRAISLEAMTCPRCRRRASSIAAARAIGEYDGSLRAIVHALKYGKRRSIARRLGAAMRQHADDLFDGVDLAVPVPLHGRRRRARGFNQAEEIARHLGVRWADALRRTRPTPSQTDLPAARRHANVRGAFALRRRQHVAGLCVLLVDDVSTTGATLEACARVLRDAGAREVRALTAARVASRTP